MKKLIIKNLPDWKLENVIDTWRFYLTNVGADMCVTLYTNNLMIMWPNDTKPSMIHHILDVVDDLVGDSWIVDGGLSDKITYLGNNETIIFDYYNGNIVND